MGVYAWEELLRRWQIGDMTVEQAIGQIFLLLKDLFERVSKLEYVCLGIKPPQEGPQAATLAGDQAQAGAAQVDDTAGEQAL